MLLLPLFSFAAAILVLYTSDVIGATTNATPVYIKSLSGDAGAAAADANKYIIYTKTRSFSLPNNSNELHT